MVRPPAAHSHAAAATAVGRQSAETGTESCSQFSVDPKNADKTGVGKIGRVSQQFSADPKYQRDPRGRFSFEPVSRGDGCTIYEGKDVSAQLVRFVVWDSDSAKLAAETKGPEPATRRRRALPRADLGKIANTVRNEVDRLPESPAGRKWLFKRRAEPFQRERVRRCRRKRTVKNSVQVSTDGTGVRIVGIETCGSARDCPVCAPEIYLGRADEIKKACVAHRAAGGIVLMATFTVRHQGSNDLKWLSTAVSEAFRSMRNSRRFKRYWQGDLGVAWVIRGDEQTHGPNGWHPHLHVLLFVPKTNPLAVEALKASKNKKALDGRTSDLVYGLYERWAECVERRLGSAFMPSVERGVMVSVSTDDEYIQKLGLEVVYVTGKEGRDEEHLNPWQLLQDATDGDLGAQKLWREHSAAMKGRRQISWSRGMKANFAVAELTDEELAQEQLDREKPRTCFDIAAWLWDYLNRSEPLWLASFVQRLRRDPDEAELLLPPKDSEAGKAWNRTTVIPDPMATGPPTEQGERFNHDFWKTLRPIGKPRWARVWKELRLRAANEKKNR